MFNISAALTWPLNLKEIKNKKIKTPPTNTLNLQHKRAAANNGLAIFLNIRRHDQARKSLLFGRLRIPGVSCLIQMRMWCMPLTFRLRVKGNLSSNSYEF